MTNGSRKGQKRVTWFMDSRLSDPTTLFSFTNQSYLGVLIHRIFLVRVEFSLLPPCWTGRDSRLFLRVLTAMFISSIKRPSMSFSTNLGISLRFCEKYIVITFSSLFKDSCSDLETLYTNQSWRRVQLVLSCAELSLNLELWKIKGTSPSPSLLSSLFWHQAPFW